MADETTAPLSDAEIAEIEQRAAKATPGPWFRHPNGTAWDGVWNGAATLVIANTEHDSDLDFIAAARTDIPRLLATLAARDAEIERLKSQVAIHETWRQDAEFRLISGHEHHMREYDFAVDDPSAFEDGRLRLRIAALKRENAAYREIVEMAAKSEGARIFEMRNRARALLADTQTPGQESE